MYDAIFISDIHLGSDTCRAKELCDLLEEIDNDTIQTQRLIINGDLFDSIDFRRLKKNHWKVLSQIRKLSDKIEVVWVKGNHDEACDVISHLIGAKTAKGYIFESGGKNVLAIHGDAYDKFISKHPILTWIADVIYALLQKIDRSCYIAKLAKKSSKTFLRCAKAVENGAIKLAGKKECQIVCCGHTHHADKAVQNGIEYFNSGCWTEFPPIYLFIEGGKMEIAHYVKL